MRLRRAIRAVVCIISRANDTVQDALDGEMTEWLKVAAC